MGLSTLLMAAAHPQPIVTGHWQFVDDGSVVQIEPANSSASRWCARLVRLSSEAATLPPKARRALCGLIIAGDLKPATGPRKGELQRFEGWVMDPEEFLASAQTEHHPATLVLISGERARLDVNDTAGAVRASYTLRRVKAPSAPCP